MTEDYRLASHRKKVKNIKQYEFSGTTGGSTIIWSVANMAMNLIDHERVVQEAVDAPRIAQTSANGSTRRELGFSDEVIQSLIDLGHTMRNPSVIGSVQAVVINKDKRQFGAADKRRIGGVVSVRRKEIQIAEIKTAPDDIRRVDIQHPGAIIDLGQKPTTHTHTHTHTHTRTLNP